MYLQLSWRNIWRNKKRTLIVASSVLFAVFFATVMRSAQEGSYSYMIHSSAKLSTGYLQIQGKEYWEKRSLDNSYVLSQEQLARIKQIAHVSHFTPRLEAFALVSSGMKTKVSQVIAIDPLLEDRMSGLKKRLLKGSYLSDSSPAILVAQGLAKMLRVEPGDSLVLYGQGYHGQTAAANLAVQGIVKLPFEIMNNGMIFISLKPGQEIFATGNRITSLPIMIDGIQNLDQVLRKTEKVLTDNQTIMTWDEMLPDLKQNIEFDNIGGIMMLAILYIVIGFGVYGTIMMMMAERSREFGILISVGMKKKRLFIVTTLETIFVSFIGAVAGLLASIPFVYYLKYHPIRITGEAAKIYDSLGIEAIFAFSNEPGVFLSQAVVVFLIALAGISYPWLFIHKLNPTQAVRD